MMRLVAGILGVDLLGSRGAGLARCCKVVFTRRFLFIAWQSWNEVCRGGRCVIVTPGRSNDRHITTAACTGYARSMG